MTPIRPSATIAVAIAMIAQISCSVPRADARARHATSPGLTIGVSFPAAQSSAPLDGRLLLLISTDSTAEPRFQIIDATSTQQAFGVDVDGLAPGQEAIFAASVLGYPVASLSSIKAGDYWVQGLLHVYNEINDKLCVGVGNDCQIGIYTFRNIFGKFDVYLI